MCSSFLMGALSVSIEPCTPLIEEVNLPTPGQKLYRIRPLNRGQLEEVEFIKMEQTSFAVSKPEPSLVVRDAAGNELRLPRINEFRDTPQKAWEDYLSYHVKALEQHRATSQFYQSLAEQAEAIVANAKRTLELLNQEPSDAGRDLRSAQQAERP